MARANGGDPYYDGYGGGYGNGWGGGGYANAYYGWQGDYYYPGTGVYVYDRYRRAHRWNGNQQRYWQGRRGGRDSQANWGGFGRDRRDLTPGGRPGWRGDTPRRDGNDVRRGWRGNDARVDGQRPGRGDGFRGQRPDRGDGVRSQRPGRSDGFRGQRSGGGRGDRSRGPRE